MALRVTQGIMYSSFTTQMNTNLSRLMETNMQGSSQKRINRPSDDAIGAGRVISYRASIERLSLYEDNIKSAMGWLSTADGVLSSEGSVMTVLTRAKTLAQQAASGTYDGSNREQISFELRNIMDQLINLSNTTFEGRHIFGGHKTEIAAYREGLAVTCNDTNFAGEQFTVEGGTKKSIVVQAKTSGTTDTATYRYSEDGGTTWKDATVDTTLGAPYGPNQMRINAGGAGIILNKGTAVSSVDIDNKNETNNGTWMYIRPTAVYQGDDHTTQVITPFGSSVGGNAQGAFPRDVSVRVDAINAGVITYSYSVDDGSNWIQGSAPDNGANTRIPIANGYLNLNGSPAVGDQFVIHPRRANIDFIISDSDSMTVNLIGKDIFGGLYQDPDTNNNPLYPTPVPGAANLFETMGRLIAFTETNSQQGVQQALGELEGVLKHIVTNAAVVGGRENRLAVTHDALVMRMYDEKDGLSSIEDVDAAELMIRQSQSNTAYSSVLKSSSMIMQLSLLNYL